MSFIEFLYQLDSWVWGMPLIVAVMLLGAYYMIRGKFFPFVHFGHTWKNTIFKKSDQTSADDSGKISPFRAFCLALGGAVGMANISGVATSIAVGGPGAIFWMWVWAFFGMMVKIVETSLGLYYRRKGPDGKYSGSAMDYMERGIAGEMGLKFGKPLAILFAISLLLMVLQGSGAYTVGETMSATFGLNLMAVVVVYILFIVYLIFRGENTIGRVAEKIVPFMCGVYLLGTVVILILNAGNIPGMFADIFKGAFTGTAAAGGFAGSAVATAIRQGVSRSVYSNEAGQRNLSADPRLRQHGPSRPAGTVGIRRGVLRYADRMHLLRAGPFDHQYLDLRRKRRDPGCFGLHRRIRQLWEILPWHHDASVCLHDLNDLVSLLPEHSQLSVKKMAGRPEGSTQSLYGRVPSDHGRQCGSRILFGLRRNAVLDHRQHLYRVPAVH